MVIFAVNVGGDAAAQSREFGPRGHWQEKTSGQGEADDFFKGGSGLSAQEPAFGIEVEQVLKREGGDHAFIETGISVGSAIALGQDRSCCRFNKIAGGVGALNCSGDSRV